MEILSDVFSSFPSFLPPYFNNSARSNIVHGNSPLSEDFATIGVGDENHQINPFSTNPPGCCVWYIWRGRGGVISPQPISPLISPG